MTADYAEEAEIFRALSDPNRLRIISMLSGEELCACHILEQLQITQPTLSHHMKVLCGCGLVSGRKEGTWMHYTLNREAADGLLKTLTGVLAGAEDRTER